MGSLYEPSVRADTISVIGRRISRRFTTLEGWREVGSGVYAMGSSGVRMFFLRHQFDPEYFRNAGFDFTHTLDNSQETDMKTENFVANRRSSEGTIGEATGSVRDGQSNSPVKNEETTEPYHMYTAQEKRALVAIVGGAASFPMLTFNMYLPTLGRIATELVISTEATNLTVTAYLMVLAIAPLFLSPLSDCFGRRSVYLVTFSIYVVSCILLSLSPSFAVLLFFRCLQAASVASTASFGYAIIRDVTLPTERDGFHAFYQAIRNGALLLGPVLGGLTSTWTDFRCLFVLLFALSLAVLLAIAFFLPETLRSIAGNGKVPLTGIHEPFAWKCKIFGKPAHVDASLQPAKRPVFMMKRILGPLFLFREKDILLSLLFSSMIFMIWMMVTVSTAGLFQDIFKINDAVLGLAFLPNFIGTIAGSALIGNLLENDFKQASSKYKHTHCFPSTASIPRHSIPSDFPIERTRLIRTPIFTVVLIVSLSLYGYTLAYPSSTSLNGWIFIPLFLQFLISATTHAICGVHQTLISEVWPNNGSNTASVASNLAQCMLAAIGVSVVQGSIECIGVGPTFLTQGVVVLVFVPLPIAQWFFAASWRSAREVNADDDNADNTTAAKH